MIPSPRPPPSLLTPAALDFHGMPNAASHLPSVSRDARYAYRTRISRNPSSPCRHRPQKRISGSPMHAPQHPNAPTAKTGPHAQRYPQSLSNPLPSLTPQPRRREPAQLPVRLLLLHRQTHFLRRPDRQPPPSPTRHHVKSGLSRRTSAPSHFPEPRITALEPRLSDPAMPCIRQPVTRTSCSTVRNANVPQDGLSASHSQTRDSVNRQLSARPA